MPSSYSLTLFDYYLSSQNMARGHETRLTICLITRTDDPYAA